MEKHKKEDPISIFGNKGESYMIYLRMPGSLDNQMYRELEETEKPMRLSDEYSENVLLEHET